jgi:ATP-dependent Clp protease ATP-binding subunit ClpA
LVFNSFTKQSIQTLVATKLEDKFGEWRESFNLHVQLDDAAMAALCQLSLDDAYGARELTRVIDKVIINKIIDLLAPNFDGKTVKISSACSPESLGAKEALYDSFSYEVIDLPESGTA